MKRVTAIVVLCLSFVGCGMAGSAGTVPAPSAQNQIRVITPGIPVLVINNNDYDWFQVNVRAGTLTIYTTGDADTTLVIYDSSAKKITGGDDDAGDNYNERITTTVSAGTYYLRVGSGDGPCILNVEAPK